jgi:hypothetical protein
MPAKHRWAAVEKGSCYIFYVPEQMFRNFHATILLMQPVQLKELLTRDNLYFFLYTIVCCQNKKKKQTHEI